MGESFDTTTVRASVGNYLVNKMIAESNEDRVIFCGDVADEIFGSYRGFSQAPNMTSFATANVEMLREIHFYDVLRSDRSISAAGLEARVPYADLALLDYVMSLEPGKYKVFGVNGKMEKDTVRRAFEGYLPDSVLWRRKEAFSDGVSPEKKNWFAIIQKYVRDNKLGTDDRAASARVGGLAAALDGGETAWYKELFCSFFGADFRPVPHYWSHPFCGDMEPSARLLSCY